MGGAAPAAAAESFGVKAWREIRRFPVIPSFILVVLLVIPAVFADLLAPHDHLLGNLDRVLEPPAWEGISKSDYDDDWDGFHEAESAVREAYRKTQAGYPTLEDLMEGESARERLRR